MPQTTRIKREKNFIRQNQVQPHDSSTKLYVQFICLLTIILILILRTFISFYFDGRFQFFCVCEDVTNRGQQLEDLILKNDLILFNDKSHTYFHSASGTFTSIDLTLCSPSLFLNNSWKVGPDPCTVTTFPSCWRTMDLLLLKGFKDGSCQRQTGINSSIYAVLVCTNLPLQMLMIPCLCSLPS